MQDTRLLANLQEGKIMKREYPYSPIPGVAAVVFQGDCVLLVKRGNEPSKGKWGLPGGGVELGEKVKDAIIREVKEETNLSIKPVRFITVLDSIERDEEEKIKYHYLLLEFLCEVESGELHPSSDVNDARFIPVEEIEHITINPWTADFIRRVAEEEGIIK